jgi:hypothetical protein
MASLVTMLTLFAATILDFIVQKIAGAAQPHLFAASFASPAPGVKIVSWIAAVGIFALFWYAQALSARRGRFFPASSRRLSYKMVMVGSAADARHRDRRGLGQLRLGHLLELGPEGDLVADHLADHAAFLITLHRRLARTPRFSP